MHTGLHDVARILLRIKARSWRVLLCACLLLLVITLSVLAASCGTAVGSSGSYEMTKLHKAADQNDVQTIAKWLAKGKNPDVMYNERGNWHEGVGIHGKTALMFAAERGHIESTKLLVEGGANIYLEAGKPDRDDKQSAFDYAVEGGNPEIVSLLWEKSDRQRFKKNGATNLAIAYRRLCWSSSIAPERERKLVHFLLDNVVDAHTASEYLMWDERCLPEIRLLLERDVKPSARALNGAAAYGHRNLVGLFLKHGAQVNELGENPTGGWRTTPLIAAVERNPEPEIVRLLLKAGANINAQEYDGRTALIAAVSGGTCLTKPHPSCEKRMAVISLLLQNGAKKDVVDRAGNTAADYVGRYGVTDPYLNEKRMLLGLATDVAGRPVRSECVDCGAASTDEISPGELRAKLWSSYKSLRSYRDKGKTIFRGSSEISQKFETYYSREHGIKLTWTEDFERLPSAQYRRLYVMWGNEKCLQNYIQLASEKIVHGCQIFRHYAPVGYNTTIQRLVPGFLYGHAEDFSKFGIKNETVEVHALPGGSKAYVLVTELSDGWITRLWVDARNFYIRRFERAGWRSAPDSSLETIVDVETVEINPVITADMVAYEPPVWTKSGLSDLDEGVAAFYRDDYAKAASLLVPLGQDGRPEAMYFVAQMYASGRWGRHDPNNAYALMKKAATAGYKPAHAGLVGLMQIFGTLIDEVRAMPPKELKQKYYEQLKAALEYERCNINMLVAVEKFIEANKEYDNDRGQWQKQKARCH